MLRSFRPDPQVTALPATTFAAMTFAVPACLLVVVLLGSSGRALAQTSSPLRLGMIGLDTSHSPGFTKIINSPSATGNLAKVKVTVAYPGGSNDVEASYTRVEKFTKEIREMGIEIAPSIADLVTKCDAVLLESVDGRIHVEQCIPVFKAGLPVFIDKPLGGNLIDALTIDEISRQLGGRWFSSSSLRFSPSIIQFRENRDLAESVVGATSWGPYSTEPHHTDLFWYGIHATETLYTAMGTGCKSVTCTGTNTVVATGTWLDGRVGTVRAIGAGKKDYGLVVFGKDKITIGGKYAGSTPLVERIADFFVDKSTPVANAETLELLTFMEAAAESKRRDGAAVTLEEILQRDRPKAIARAKKLLAQ